jgi:2-polyprenyl-3-methyl-5-hydroxy-6-metoxy-1,4-benzoquinol methylase
LGALQAWVTTSQGVDEHDHRLGLHGHALLRAGAVGDEEAVVAHRLEIRRLLDAGPSSLSRTLRSVPVSEGYAYWAKSYDGRANPTIVAEQQAVQWLLKDRPAGDAVDVGAGTGRHTRWLLEQGHRVTAVDASEEMLAIAAREAAGARTLLGDVREILLPDQCADIVVCALVLSHLPDLSPISGLARLLRPGGRLIISNPHPFATAVLGSRAWANTPDGERVQIPEFAHPLGAYVEAFRAASLIPSALLEPTHPAEDDLLAKEPAVVVWAADRPAAT